MIDAEALEGIRAEALLEQFKFDGAERVPEVAGAETRSLAPTASSKSADMSWALVTPVSEVITAGQDLCSKTGLESEDGGWINSIWQAIDLDLANDNGEAAVTESPVDTLEVLPPVFSAQNRFVTSTIPLLNHPLNISPKDPRELGQCVCCHQDIAIAILHDASSQHNQPRVLDITCVGCWLGVDDVSVPLKVTVRIPGKGKRKRAAGSGPGTKVWCDVCNHHIAYGGMRMEIGDSGWHEPDFRTEYICASCVVDFNCCSACGGQTAYRSGKWRPRQMFRDGMRTCVALHRIAWTITKNYPQSSIVSYHLPNTRAENKGWDLMPVFVRGGVDAVPKAVPETMRLEVLHDVAVSALRKMRDTLIPFAEILRRSPQWWSWENWVRFNEPLYEYFENYFLGDEGGVSDRHVRKYAIVGVASSLDESRSVNKGREVVGFSNFIWFPVERRVWLGAKILYDGKGSRELMQVVISRIERDAGMLNLPLPLYIWNYVNKGLWELELDESTLMFEGMKNHILYARNNGLDADELRSTLVLDVYPGVSPHRNPGMYKWQILPWEDRADFGNGVDS